MTEKENSSIGWNPCYTTVCIGLSGTIIRSGERDIMVKFAKENNYIVADIEIISFEKEGE